MTFIEVVVLLFAGAFFGFGIFALLALSDIFNEDDIEYEDEFDD